MRAIEAETFSGYGGLRQIELPEPQPAKDRVLVRVTAAGVTPLDHTILSGGHPRAKAPLVLGNEGAGVIEDAGDSRLAVGSRALPYAPAARAMGIQVEPSRARLGDNPFRPLLFFVDVVLDLLAQHLDFGVVKFLVGTATLKFSY
jgi:hypothetical protein